MFVFNFRCTNSSGPQRSEEFERTRKQSSRIAKTAKDLALGDEPHIVARATFRVCERSLTSFGMTTRGARCIFHSRVCAPA